MNWIDKLLGRQQNSGSVAKNRLQMVLAHDRGSISPGKIDMIRNDIIQVIAKHLEIDPQGVEVNLNQDGRSSFLVAEVPLHPNGR